MVQGRASSDVESRAEGCSCRSASPYLAAVSGVPTQKPLCGSRSRNRLRAPAFSTSDAIEASRAASVPVTTAHAWNGTPLFSKKFAKASTRAGPLMAFGVGS